MMFPFLDEEALRTREEEVALPKEYEIDFATGQLTGRIVEGIEAIKVWAFLALQTPRYRYYIYSWDYGQEYESLMGQGFTTGYMQMELKRMTEECLTVHPYIEGIENFTCEKEEERARLSFTLVTTVGDTEVEAVV